MAWTIDNGHSTSGICVGIHPNSGGLTYGGCGCSKKNDIINNCERPNGGSVTASLLSGSTFDDFTKVRKTITYSFDVIGCDKEWLVTKFNSASSTFNVLDNNNGFDIKMVDDNCNHLIYGTPMKIGTQTFENSGVHTIKYHTTNNTIRTNTIVNNQYLTDLYFPHLYEETGTGFTGVNITTIEEGAFSGCTSLSAITFSAVQHIGDKSFSDCTSLTTIDWGHLSDCCNAKNCKKENYIGNYAFSNCTSLETLGDFGSLNTLTTLGTGAFKNCRKLKNVTIPSSLTAISAETFMNCNSLKEINIPNTVSSLGNNSFNNCYSASALTLSNNLTVIPYGCFSGCTRITGVTIPNSVTTIGNNAFGWCSSLKNITISSGVTIIGNSAFINCTNLTALTIPNSVTTLGNNAFDMCTLLTNITIGDGLAEISPWAFQYCGSEGDGITMTIGSSITSIGAMAFMGAKIVTLTIKKSINNKDEAPNLGGNEYFMEDYITSIKVPADSVEYYKQADGWSDFANKISPI